MPEDWKSKDLFPIKERPNEMNLRQSEKISSKTCKHRKIKEICHSFYTKTA